MSFKRVNVFATFLAATVALAGGAAHATIATQTENITLSGTFGPVVGPAALDPFGSGPFTLNFSVPLSSFAQGYALGDGYAIGSAGGQSGTYTVGGQSYPFSSGSLDVMGTSPTTFQIGGDLSNSLYSVTFSGTSAAHLFTATSSASGVTYTLTPGTYDLTDTSAFANNDPRFTGGVLTIANPASSVPEPSTLALIAFPLALLALTRRRKCGPLI